MRLRRERLGLFWLVLDHEKPQQQQIAETCPVAFLRSHGFNRFKIAVNKFQFTLRREPGAGFTSPHGKILGVLNTASITTRRSAVFAILSSIASRISFS